MQIRLLLGPAGSGKTFRCLNEIRDELALRPEGPTLIFLAPKQATFQLERQLLDGGTLSGYSRLRIFSFQRLARFIFEAIKLPLPNLLSTEGKVMVLRALLNEHHPRLTIFKSSARRLGFAEEASEQIREFQQHGLTPGKLREIAATANAGPVVQKLQDLALLYESYNEWLAANRLEDEEWLLTLAAERLAQNPGCFSISGVWFDGFAQLTPGERALLRTLLGETKKALLAFCLDKPVGSSFSPWFLVSQTFERCRSELETRFGKESLTVEWRERAGAGQRFSASTDLAHLEKFWAGGPFSASVPASIRILECADPEMEVTACARDIVRFVREGGRYRDTAVLLRGFSNDYPFLFRRIFSRYHIPFFLDHREGVAHHPLAELTRGALRMIVFGYQHQDCFGVFKSGLLAIAPEFLDDLENEALSHGWEGLAWRDGFKLPKDPARETELNMRREKLIQPFRQFSSRLGEKPSGPEIARAFRELWTVLHVEEQLEEWNREAAGAIHHTVWEQMIQWIENLELAFARQRLLPREWLPLVEAGLNGLTVGIIPPVLDQVLIGTVDRSRNPDLQRIFVLGLNEGFFPAIPPHKPLLTEQDRDAFLDVGRELANVPSMQISQEQFYGYIACTRAREQVVMSYARTTAEGKALNPSRFVGQVQRLFPNLAVEYPRKPQSLDELEHACELDGFGQRHGLPAELREKVRSLPVPDAGEQLDPQVATQVYGTDLNVSVSAMERFAMCPFRFFLEQALGVKEREEFSLDIREQGSFQHAVLARYHEEVCRAGKQWRDLSPAEAGALMVSIADEEMAKFRDGLFLANEQNRFTGDNYKAALQDFIEAITGWFAFNQFDPEAVELSFGQDEGLPGLKILLENGCTLVLSGRIDRVDLRRSDGRAAIVVIDYKSGSQQPDKLCLQHGIQQQLPAYLLALTRLPEARDRFKVAGLDAVGCFYVPLGSRYENETTRNKVLKNLEEARKGAYTYRGLFDLAHLPHFDSGFKESESGQFDYRLTKEHQPYGNSFSALRSEDFQGILAQLETNTKDFGMRIYEGDIAIRPFKKGKQIGCKHCPHQPICRFDPWVQEYHVLGQ